MNKKKDKNNRRIVDVLLVIVIIAMGLFIYYRVNQILSDRKTESLGLTYESMDGLTPEPTSESTKFFVDNQSDQLASTQEHQDNTFQPALDFSLESLEDRNISLSDFKGTPVMVNFWATWCPPCRAEMPLIQSYAEANRDEVVVLAVNAGEDKATVESFATAQDLDDLVFLLDPDNSVASLYRIPGFPTSLFIDAEGMLTAAHIGELNEDLLIQYLAKIGVK
jgi:thiol-disulfide isomerase/thioredoxin